MTCVDTECELDIFLVLLIDRAWPAIRGLPSLFRFANRFVLRHDTFELAPERFHGAKFVADGRYRLEGAVQFIEVL